MNFDQNPPSARLQLLKDAADNYITFVGGGTVARCERVGSTLRADSAEYYETVGQLILVGNVVYDEPRRARMTSARLTYYTTDERMLAEGNVIVTLPSGSTMMGPSVEYLRAVARVRPTSRLTAIGRPTLRVIGGAARAAGSTRPRGPDTSVTTIVANTIVNDADSVVYASGAVAIDRADVLASSDSATFDESTEIARLLRNASIRGKRGRPFTLTGARVDLFARERQLTRVVARDSARIVSAELNLRSDTVDMRLREGQVERAFAWGPSRAVATSPERDVTADSIEAILPAQRVRELIAVRRAVARSVTDTTRIVSTERDILRGDTIRAQFDSTVAAGDTSRTPPVRRILALGNASSLYQIASKRGRTLPPSINYVRGKDITVAFDSGQARSVTVTQQATGVFLEPATDSASVDTLALPAAAGAGPPTLGAPIPTPGAGPRPPLPTAPTPPAPRRPTPPLDAALPSALETRRDSR